MRCPVAFSVFGLATVAALFAGAQPAGAGPSTVWTATSWLGEAAVVAFAFALPALMAGAYLLVRRVWAGVRSHVGLSIAAVSLLLAAAVVFLGFEIPGTVKLLGMAGS